MLQKLSQRQHTKLDQKLKPEQKQKTGTIKQGDSLSIFLFYLIINQMIDEVSISLLESTMDEPDEMNKGFKDDFKGRYIITK